jgi:hypothetical protein
VIGFTLPHEKTGRGARFGGALPGASVSLIEIIRFAPSAKKGWATISVELLSDERRCLPDDEVAALRGSSCLATAYWALRGLLNRHNPLLPSTVLPTIFPGCGIKLGTARLNERFSDSPNGFGRTCFGSSRTATLWRLPWNIDIG